MSTFAYSKPATTFATNLQLPNTQPPLPSNILKYHTHTHREPPAIMNPVDLTAKYIDSRDIIARLAYLDQLAEYAADQEDTEENRAEHQEELDEASEEREALKEAAEEGANECEEWEDGATLIRSDCFEDYARELAEDTGAIDREAAWPLRHIDWEAAADELREDYRAEIDIDGTTYFSR